MVIKLRFIYHEIGLKRQELKQSIETGKTPPVATPNAIINPKVRIMCLL